MENKIESVTPASFSLYNNYKENVYIKKSFSYIDSNISPVIMGIKNLQLTKAGQVKLSMFNDTYILMADEAIKSARNLKNPFGAFWSLCKKYSLADGIYPNWERYNFLAEKHGVKKEDCPLKPYVDTFEKTYFDVYEKEPKKVKGNSYPYSLFISKKEEPTRRLTTHEVEKRVDSTDEAFIKLMGGIEETMQLAAKILVTNV